MKKFEEAKLEILLVKNNVIRTSGGCGGGKDQYECVAGFDASTDECGFYHG